MLSVRWVAMKQTKRLINFALLYIIKVCQVLNASRVSGTLFLVLYTC